MIGEGVLAMITIYIFYTSDSTSLVLWRHVYIISQLVWAALNIIITGQLSMCYG